MLLLLLLLPDEDVLTSVVLVSFCTPEQISKAVKLSSAAKIPWMSCFSLSSIALHSLQMPSSEQYLRGAHETIHFPAVPFESFLPEDNGKDAANKKRKKEKEVEEEEEEKIKTKINILSEGAVVRCVAAENGAGLGHEKYPCDADNSCNDIHPVDGVTEPNPR